MNQRILITGSSGLIGSALAAPLQNQGAEIEYFDIVADGSAYGDIRDFSRVCQAVEKCDGIIHLAAVSRVIWGEQNPELCQTTNVGGLHNVLKAIASLKKQPWIIFASSREVYGQPDHLPADEDCPISPVNIYGHAKVEGEQLIKTARKEGIRACTIQLSNVFGTTTDHEDRVVPAFARGAALGEELRVDGANHTFDFTYIDDVARGIATLTDLLNSNELPPPPIHFVSGVPTTLDQLAKLAIQIAGTQSTIRYAPERNFDVARFVGNNARAKKILGWQPQVLLEQGLAKLIQNFRNSI